MLAKEGLMAAMVYAWIGTTPKIVKLIQDDKIKAWNFPFGCGENPDFKSNGSVKGLQSSNLLFKNPCTLAYFSSMCGSLGCLRNSPGRKGHQLNAYSIVWSIFSPTYR